MSTSFAEAMQDATAGAREVTLSCDACPATWTVFVPEGGFPTYDDTVCRDNSCSGEGEEM
jgi:hypothetical protein